MSEAVLIKEIQIAASKLGARLFRQNIGFGWIGTVRHVGNDVIIRNPRPFRAGLTIGSSDLIGWTKDGKFAAVEVKFGETKITSAQQQFIDQVLAAGGRAGISRSVEDALAILALDKV